MGKTVARQGLDRVLRGRIQIPDQRHRAALSCRGLDVEYKSICGLSSHDHTTEDKVPLLLQRRQAARAAFAWAIALDGADIRLEVIALTDTTGQPLDPAEATLVRVHAGEKAWTLLANPQKKAVILPRSGGSSSPSDAVFAVQ